MKTKIAAVIPTMAIMASMESPSPSNQGIPQNAGRRIERMFGSFVCPEPKCGKRYRAEKALNRHILKIHG